MTLDTNTIVSGVIVAIAVGIYRKILEIGETLASHSATLVEHTKSDTQNFETIREDIREVRTEARAR